MKPNILPILQTISQQQDEALKRMDALIEVLKKERQPIEPILRTLLDPLNTHIDQIKKLVNDETPSTEPLEAAKPH